MVNSFLCTYMALLCPCHEMGEGHNYSVTHVCLGMYVVCVQEIVSLVLNCVMHGGI